MTMTTGAAVRLSSRRDSPAREAIAKFVARVCEELALDERVAVFDHDSTLCCERPVPIQLDFIVRRLAPMAEDDPALREPQPWKAADERDVDWLGAVAAEHYVGDETNVRVLAAGILAAYDGIGVEDTGAERALERAAEEQWTVVSMREDWVRIWA